MYRGKFTHVETEYTAGKSWSRDHICTWMYVVLFDWLLCRMEYPLRLVSSECMRLPHTHTHSVVISVLADLLMLTCSACLLGSWCCIRRLSLSLLLSPPFLSHSFLSFLSTLSLSFLYSFFLAFFISFSNLVSDIANMIFCLYTDIMFYAPECLWLSQMYECIFVYVYTGMHTH